MDVFEGGFVTVRIVANYNNQVNRTLAVPPLELCLSPCPRSIVIAQDYETTCNLLKFKFNLSEAVNFGSPISFSRALAQEK